MKNKWKHEYEVDNMTTQKKKNELTQLTLKQSVLDHTSSRRCILRTGRGDHKEILNFSQQSYS